MKLGLRKIVHIAVFACASLFMIAGGCATSKNQPAAESAVDKGCSSDACNAGFEQADEWGYSNSKEETQLLSAASAGNLARAEALIANGADVNQGNWVGLTPLIRAIIKGKTEMAQALIKWGADIHLADDYLKTPLMYALDFGDDALVKQLIDAGADVNARHSDGRTPLMFSHSAKNTKLLLDAGADPYTRDNDGKNALFYASDEDILSLLIKDAGVVPSYDRNETYPESLSRNLKMAMLYYAAYHRVNDDLLFDVCDRQPRKIYVNPKDLNPRTDEELERYVKSVVEANGEKYIGIDRRLGFDSDGKLTVYVQNDQQVVSFYVMAMIDRYGEGPNIKDDEGRTLLMYAANGRNPETFRWLMNHGADIHAKSPAGTTALLIAAGSLPEVVDELIAQHADVNVVQTSSGMTPLIEAANHGNVDAVKSLLAAGANVNAEDDYGRSALNCASEGGYTEVVKVLLAAGADVNHVTKYGKESSLIVASYNGYSEIVKLLLDAKADFKLEDSRGKTALIKATKADIVTMLLNAGASAKEQSSTGWTPLMHQYRSYDMLEAYLFGSDQIINPEPEIAKILIKAGADVNARTSDSEGGYTPLYLACKGGDVETVKLLIESGADVNATSEYSDRPLHVAANAEIVKALLAAGADAKAIGYMEHSTLHYRNDAESVRALLAAGADVNARNEFDDRPIDSSSLKPEVIKVLLDAGADINPPEEGKRAPFFNVESPEAIDVFVAAGADYMSKTEDGDTALHHAAEFGSIQVMLKLIGMGLDVNAKNHDGATPLILASRWNKASVVNWLIKKGADVNAKLDNGESALVRAACTEKYTRDRQYTVSHLIEMLIKAGADVNAKKGKLSALDCAEQEHDYSAARTLVMAGADVGDNLPSLMRSAGALGDTALARILAPMATDKNAKWAQEVVIITSSWGNDATLRVLLEAGFNPNAEVNGQSALTITNSSRCTKTLLEFHADPNIPNLRGETPLDRARRLGYSEMEKVLIDGGAKDLDQLIREMGGK